MAFRNVKIVHDTKAETLTCVIDISKAAIADAEPSSTGKKKLVASTGGFCRYGEVGLSLNVTN